MPNKYTITYGGRNLVTNAIIDSDVPVKYDGRTLINIKPGESKLFTCQNDLMTTDLEIGTKILKCAKKKMSTDVKVSVERDALYIYKVGASGWSNVTNTEVWNSHINTNFNSERARLTFLGGSNADAVLLFVNTSGYKKLVADIKVSNANDEFNSNIYWSNKSGSDTNYATGYNSPLSRITLNEGRYTYSMDIPSGATYVGLGMGLYSIMEVYDIHLE